MKRLSLVVATGLLASISILSGTSFAQSYTDSPHYKDGHYEVEFPFKEYTAAFMAALLNREVVEPREDEFELVGRVDRERLWRGNSPELEAVVRKLYVVLERDEGSIDEDDVGYRRFEISIVLNPGGQYVWRGWQPHFVRVATTLREGTDSWGITSLEPKPDREVARMLRGDRGTSMFIRMPRTKGRDFRGILFCPRDYPKQGRDRRSRKLVDTGYRIVDARFEIDASAEGKVFSGYGAGLARASIVTSAGVPRAMSWIDQNRRKDPWAGVKYRSSGERERRSPWMGKNLVAGVRSELELETHVGDNRRSYLEQVVWITEVPIEQEFPLWFKKREVRVQPGQCFVVLHKTIRKHLIAKFDKSESQSSSKSLVVE